MASRDGKIEKKEGRNTEAIIALAVLFGIIFFARVIILVKIIFSAKNRHKGILLGKRRVYVYAITESFIDPRRLFQWIKMSREEVERELDKKFCPTHLI